MRKPPDISVVVCTYNRAEILRRALASLAVQRCPTDLEYEIVVVDDGSTDHTADVVREANRCTQCRVIYVRESGRGVSAARNAGVAAAHGGWIAFTDDDQIARSDWLVNLWRAQIQTGAECIGGARTLELPEATLRGMPTQTRLLLGEISTEGDLRACSRDALVCTGNLLVRRSLVLQAGGFDETLTQGGEDTDLLIRIRRAGHTCWFTPRAVVGHIIPTYRLGEDYLLWAAMRGGDCYAVRDVREWGIGKSSVVALARLVQGALIHVPAMLFARLCGRHAYATAYKCRLMRAIAYVKRVGRACMGAQRAQPKVSSTKIEFRGERNMFDRMAG